MLVKTLKNNIKCVLSVMLDEDDIRVYGVNDDLDDDVKDLRVNRVNMDEDDAGVFCQISVLK